MTSIKEAGMKGKNELYQVDFLNRYEPIHQRLMRYAKGRSLGVIDFEDLLQETILATLIRYPEIKDKDRLLAYMMSVVNNIINQQLRKKKIKSEDLALWADRIQDKNYDPELRLDVEKLLEQLHALPSLDQQLIHLYEIQGYSIRKISELLNLSISATKTRLHRARKKLRQAFANDAEQRYELALSSLAVLILAAL